MSALATLFARTPSIPTVHLYTIKKYLDTLNELNEEHWDRSISHLNTLTDYALEWKTRKVIIRRGKVVAQRARNLLERVEGREKKRLLKKLEVQEKYLRDGWSRFESGCDRVVDGLFTSFEDI